MEVSLCIVTVDEAQQQLVSLLHATLESLRMCGILLQPIMPASMSTLLDRLGIPLERRLFGDTQQPQDVVHSLGPAGEHLFKKQVLKPQKGHPQA